MTSSQINLEKHKKKQQGGKYLTQGAYGCVFEAPLTCKPGTTKSYLDKSQTDHKSPVNSGRFIGKVTPVGEESVLEQRASSEITKIPNYDDYFVVPISSCIPKPRVQQTETELYKCDSILKPARSVIQFTMPYGGRTILDVINHQDTLKKFIPHFFYTVGHFLEAGALLVLNQYIHFDLHRSNLLFYSDFKIRIIDFGVAWKPVDIDDTNIILFREYEPNSVQEPPELTLINGMVQNDRVRISRSSESFITDIFQRKKILRHIERVLNKSQDSLIKEFKEFISNSKVFKTNNWDEYFRLYWTKIDSWSIGAILLMIYEKLLTEHEFINSQEYKTKKHVFEDLLESLACVDPFKRYDSVKALSIWDPTSKILQSEKAKHWLEELEKH